MSGLTEETTKLRYITPAITQAGWDLEHNSCEDYFFSDGKVIIDGKDGKRAGKGNKTDYQLCYPNANTPLAVVEAKDYQNLLARVSNKLLIMQSSSMLILHIVQMVKPLWSMIFQLA